MTRFTNEKKKNFIIFVLFFILACTEKDQIQKKSFLWQLEYSNNISYILGSIHLLKKDIYPLNDIIDTTFFKSDVLVLEVNFSKKKRNEFVAQMMKVGMYQNNETLKNNISTTTYKQIKSLLKKRYDLDISSFNKFKPWLLALIISKYENKKMGFSPDYGIDMYFFNKAFGKKEIKGLETAEFHIKLLEEFSNEDQEKFLDFTLKELKQSNKYMKEIIKSWFHGDPEKMEKLLFEIIMKYPEFKHINKVLLQDRNVKMVSKIENLMKNNKKYFIVVGAAHLLGKNGIIQMLINKGYNVKQL